jgi:hypothetical protein
MKRLGIFDRQLAELEQLLDFFEHRCCRLHQADPHEPRVILPAGQIRCSCEIDRSLLLAAAVPVMSAINDHQVSVRGKGAESCPSRPPSREEFAHDIRLGSCSGPSPARSGSPVTSDALGRRDGAFVNPEIAWMSPGTSSSALMRRYAFGIVTNYELRGLRWPRGRTSPSGPRRPEAEADGSCPQRRQTRSRVGVRQANVTLRFRAEPVEWDRPDPR